MDAIKPSCLNGHLDLRKCSNPKLDVARLLHGNSGDGPVAAMQHVRIVSAAFLNSTFGKSRRPQSLKSNNHKVNDCRHQDKENKSYNAKGFEQDAPKSKERPADLWDEESFETSDESNPDEASNDFSESTTDSFQTEGECDGSEEKDKQKEDIDWPEASGDATSARKSATHQREPLFRGDPSQIQKILKTLEGTLTNERKIRSATRPTTPTVCIPDPCNLDDAAASRGSGDMHVSSRGCVAWAAWYNAKQKEIDKKREEIRKEAEKKLRAEQEETALQQQLKVAAFNEWLQRKDAQHEATMKEYAASLEALRREENERLLVAKEASQRAVAQWRRRKDQELKERRLQEEMARAEAEEKERQRKQLAATRVKEWRKMRASPCALNAERFVNPKPWKNIVEIPEESEEKPSSRVQDPRPRRTRREQDRICTRLSRPSGTLGTAKTEPETDCKGKLSWVQRVKNRSYGTKRPEAAPKRRVSAQPRTKENNLEIILPRSDCKSPASRTSEWIKSVMSRRYDQENTAREKSASSMNKTRLKSSAKQKSRKIDGNSAGKDKRSPSKTKPKTEPNPGKRIQTR